MDGISEFAEVVDKGGVVGGVVDLVELGSCGEAEDGEDVSVRADCYVFDPVRWGELVDEGCVGCLSGCERVEEGEEEEGLMVYSNHVGC